jgi:hypothetical protein
MSQTNLPPDKSRAEAMRELRLQALTTSPGQLGQKPTEEFPKVCRVVMDWPLEKATVTVAALNTGDASIYSTASFGVIGGFAHETVRAAAKNCVKVAQQYYDASHPTKDFPYPASDRIRFYLVGYDGVRVIDTDFETIKTGKSKFSELFLAAQKVVTELRLVTQRQKPGNP